MVDLNNSPSTPRMGEGSKIKSLMGRTPGILKTKFLTVLGNSNEILNGISNRFTLSISSSDSDYCDDDEEEVPQYDEKIDYSKIDFESRRVKARRAHEEIISGRFRHPNWAPKVPLDKFKSTSGTGASKSSSSSSSSSRSSTGGIRNSCCNSVNSKSTPNDIDIENDLKKINELLSTPPVIDVEPPPVPPDLEPSDGVTKLVGNALKNIPSKTSNSSTLTSIYDPVLASPSLESTDWKNYIRSESQNSVPSWASSISLDEHRCDDPAKDFMKRFSEILFTNPTSIGLELKSEFGQVARQESGRIWFCRYMLAQKLKSKRVDEITFYSLVQNFAIILFECTESEDYIPAASIMNLCFMFYHEIEVPGCEPYREYLFTYLRQQPIWHTLRFWNEAFFDAMQNQHRHLHLDVKEKREKRRAAKLDALSRTQSDGEEDKSESLSSCSRHSYSPKVPNKQSENVKDREYIAFQQLGTFTCNMHSLGINKDLCLEFLRKQGAATRLPADKMSIIRDNINRMYYETDLWGAKES